MEGHQDGGQEMPQNVRDPKTTSSALWNSSSEMLAQGCKETSIETFLAILLVTEKQPFKLEQLSILYQDTG